MSKVVKVSSSRRKRGKRSLEEEVIDHMDEEIFGRRFDGSDDESLSSVEVCEDDLESESSGEGMNGVDVDTSEEEMELRKTQPSFSNKKYPFLSSHASLYTIVKDLVKQKVRHVFMKGCRKCNVKFNGVPIHKWKSVPLAFKEMEPDVDSLVCQYIVTVDFFERFWPEWREWVKEELLSDLPSSMVDVADNARFTKEVHKLLSEEKAQAANAIASAMKKKGWPYLHRSMSTEGKKIRRKPLCFPPELVRDGTLVESPFRYLSEKELATIQTPEYLTRFLLRKRREKVCVFNILY